jgi:hypothetical protein
MCRIFLAAARCEASSRRFGRGLRTCSSAACRRTKRMFSAMLPEEDNQILRRDGELRSLRLTDRALSGPSLRSRSIQIRFERILRHGLGVESWHCAPERRCNRGRGRGIVLDAEEVSIRRDRLQQICDGSLRTELCDGAVSYCPSRPRAVHN